MNILTITHLDQLCRVYISEHGLFIGACLSSSITKKEGILLLRCSSTGHSKLVLLTLLTKCVDVHTWNLTGGEYCTFNSIYWGTIESAVTILRHTFCIILNQNWSCSSKFLGSCKSEIYVTSHLEEILCIHISDSRQTEFIVLVVIQVLVQTSEYDFIISVQTGIVLIIIVKSWT